LTEQISVIELAEQEQEQGDAPAPTDNIFAGAVVGEPSEVLVGVDMATGARETVSVEIRLSWRGRSSQPNIEVAHDCTIDALRSELADRVENRLAEMVEVILTTQCVTPEPVQDVPPWGAEVNLCTAWCTPYRGRPFTGSVGSVIHEDEAAQIGNLMECVAADRTHYGQLFSTGRGSALGAVRQHLEDVAAGVIDEI
jgi:hypothetical protein